MSGCGRDKSQDGKVDRMALVEFISGYLINEKEGCSKEEVKLLLAELNEKVMESFPDGENAAQESLPLDNGGKGNNEALCPVDGNPKGCAVNCKRIREWKTKE